MRVMACICQFVPRLSSSFAHVQCLHGGLASGQWYSIWCQKAVGFGRLTRPRGGGGGGGVTASGQGDAPPGPF